MKTTGNGDCDRRIRVQVRLSSDRWADLKAVAALRKQTMQEVLADAVDKIIEDYKEKHGAKFHGTPAKP
jgi:hypothetical protein